MTREQLEHVIRAAAAITGVEDIVVIGSQCVLGQFPDAPAELLISQEADVYPLGCPERSDLIDGSIGKDRPFRSRSATMPTAWTIGPRYFRMAGGNA